MIGLLMTFLNDRDVAVNDVEDPHTSQELAQFLHIDA
jgi:hypothetical protein